MDLQDIQVQNMDNIEVVDGVSTQVLQNNISVIKLQYIVHIIVAKYHYSHKVCCMYF